ncbi:hypothetical protein [Nonomuraea sp. NPDC049709]|uniref:MmyB family transcriptional regulator n=1 Tax=Nonomuraea sp. NPDC049709 TaxID=3154736 RepID=UPI00341635B4
MPCPPRGGGAGGRRVHASKRIPALRPGEVTHKALHKLVGDLSTRSDDFRRRWFSHDVRTHAGGVKHFRHHVAGDLALAYESMDLRGEPGLSMTVFTAEPGSPTAQALALLASWAATQEGAPAGVPLPRSY